MMSRLLEQGVDKGAEVRLARSVLVKRAVGANAMTERDVKVEMHFVKIEH